MKYFFPILVLFAMIGGCSDPAATTTNYGDTCTLTQNREQKVSFIADGFGKTNLLIDFDVRKDSTADPIDSHIFFTQLYFKNEDGSYEFWASAGTSNPVKIGDSYHNVRLEVHIPSLKSGEYQWTGTSTFIGRYGVNFILADYPDYVGIYKPISGHTLIAFSGSQHNQVPDSVFGSFCGTLQNDQGEKLTVHDGKFFGIFP